MSENKNINLQRYSDGTPSILRKQTVYTELFFYRKSDVLVQLTKAFCDRFLPKYGDRTVDQMVQAARSVKQNIAEGLTDGRTSFEVEIKLLGIAMGSNQELLEDYQDYMKANNITEWASPPSNANKEYYSSRFNKLREFCKTHSDDKDFRPFYYRWTDEEMCNTALCLCHMVDRAMTMFMKNRDREFVEEGGIRERMTAARLEHRGTQKQIIDQLKAENTTLRARIASLEREIEAIKAGNSGGDGNSGIDGNPGGDGDSGDDGNSGGDGSSGVSGDCGMSGEAGNVGLFTLKNIHS